MLLERLQIAAIIIVTIMFLIVSALLLETTLISDECENCNSIFHNFSTTCTLNFTNKKNQEEIVIQDDEILVASASLDLSKSNNFQSTCILEKTYGYIADDYLNSITYIGDSRFVGMLEYGIDSANVLAKSGLNHKQALTQNFVELPNGQNATLVGALQYGYNDIILINFGVNGAGWFSESEFISCYNELLDVIVANTDDVTIVIQSILPIAQSYEYKENGFPNDRIDYFNEFLLQIALERGFYYLDSSDVLKDSNNFLDTKYTNDGLHFNSKGYELLLQHMKEYTVYN